MEAKGSCALASAGVKVDEFGLEAEIRGNSAGDVVNGQFANAVYASDCSVNSLVQIVKRAACRYSLLVNA